MLTLVTSLSPVFAEIVEWNKTYGGTEFDSGYSVIQTNDGGYAMAGTTYSFGEGGGDVWLVKTDANGNVEWNRTYGGEGNELGYSIVQTRDGGYAITGWTTSYGDDDESNLYLIKTDSEGDVEHMRAFDEQDRDRGYSIVEAINGGYVIAGETMDANLNKDLWLIKVDSTLRMEWSETYGGVGDELGYSIVQTRNGEYVITGQTSSFGVGGFDLWLVKTNATGFMLLEQKYEGGSIGYSIVQTRDGGYAITGDTQSYGAGLGDVWLIKIDDSGAIQWNQTFGGVRYDGGRSIFQMRDGGFIIAGETNSFGPGFADLYLIRTDTDGNLLWNRTYGNMQYDSGHSVVETRNGGIAVAGWTHSSEVSEMDLWLIYWEDRGVFEIPWVILPVIVIIGGSLAFIIIRRFLRSR